MARLTKRERIGVGIETTQGTYVAPTNTNSVAAAGYFWAEGVEVTLNSENLERNYYRNSFSGTIANLKGKKTADVKFKMELLYTATSAEVGAMQTLFEACGYISNGTSYVPLSTDYTGFQSPAKSCSLSVNKDGLVHRIQGCVGTAKIILEAGKLAMIEFNFKGINSEATFGVTETIASITPAYLNNVSGVLNSVVKSDTFTFNSISTFIVSKIEIDLGNEIYERSDIASSHGVLGFSLVGRKPTMSVSLEAPAVATDVIGYFEAGTASAASVVITGYTFTIANAQVTSASYTDVGGILGHEVGFNLCETSAGDDALLIVEATA